MTPSDQSGRFAAEVAWARRLGVDPALWSREELGVRAEQYRGWISAALQPAPELRLSEWAQAKVVLPSSEPIPGRLDLSRNPCLRGLLDLYTNPEVYHVSSCKSTQVGYSLGLICLAGYCVEHRKVPVLVVQPKRSNAKSFNRSRVQPVFEASEDLAVLLPPGRGNTDFEVQHVNGVKIRYATAGSPSDLAEASVPVVLNDEVDKFPASSGREADPIKLAEERKRWWNWTMQVDQSTPTTESGYIWRQLNAAPCQLRFYVQCPLCGAWQIPSFDGEKESIRRGEQEIVFPGPAGRINWPKNALGHALHTPAEIAERKLAWYECGACEGVWPESRKAEIVAGGQWRTLDGQPPRGHVGVRTWCFVSPRLSFSDIAKEYLTSRDRPELEMNFENSWLARPYRQKGARPTFEIVQSRREGYLTGSFPAGVRFLTGGVDVHSARNQQYWMVVGWGAGFTGYLVAAGREDTAVDPAAGWNRVYEAVTRDYHVADRGGAHGTLCVGQGAGIALMDSGWYKRQDADPDEIVNEAEVIERCDAWNARLGGNQRLFYPSKGGSTPAMFPPLDFRGKTYDRTRRGKPLRNRLELHMFNPWFFKKDFYRRLQHANQVGGLWLPADVPELVMRQLMSEECVTQPDGSEAWERRTANHWLDTFVLCLVAAWRFRMFLETAVAHQGEAAAGSGTRRVRVRDHNARRGR